MDITTLAMAKNYTDKKAGGIPVFEDVLRSRHAGDIMSGIESSCNTGYYFSSFTPSYSTAPLLEAAKAFFEDGGVAFAYKLSQSYELPMCVVNSVTRQWKSGGDHDYAAHFVLPFFSISEAGVRYYSNVTYSVYEDRVDVYATTTKIG